VKQTRGPASRSRTVNAPGNKKTTTFARPSAATKGVPFRKKAAIPTPAKPVFAQNKTQISTSQFDDFVGVVSDISDTVLSDLVDDSFGRLNALGDDPEMAHRTERRPMDLFATVAQSLSGSNFDSFRMASPQPGFTRELSGRHIGLASRQEVKGWMKMQGSGPIVELARMCYVDPALVMKALEHYMQSKWEYMRPPEAVCGYVAEISSPRYSPGFSMSDTVASDEPHDFARLRDRVNIPFVHVVERVPPVLAKLSFSINLPLLGSKSIGSSARESESCVVDGFLTRNHTPWDPSTVVEKFIGVFVSRIAKVSSSAFTKLLQEMDLAVMGLTAVLTTYATAFDVQPQSTTLLDASQLVFLYPDGDFLLVGILAQSASQSYDSVLVGRARPLEFQMISTSAARFVLGSVLSFNRFIRNSAQSKPGRAARVFTTSLGQLMYAPILMRHHFDLARAQLTKLRNANLLLRTFDSSSTDAPFYHASFPKLKEVFTEKVRDYPEFMAALTAGERESLRAELSASQLHYMVQLIVICVAEHIKQYMELPFIPGGTIADFMTFWSSIESLEDLYQLVLSDLFEQNNLESLQATLDGVPRQISFFVMWIFNRSSEISEVEV